MAASPKIAPYDIIEAAFNIVRKNGWAKFSAREIAKELNTSTMPIYSKFKSIAALEEEIVRKSMELLRQYQTKTYIGDESMDRAIGYVMFAQKEYHLFQTINDEKLSAWQAKYGDPTFELHTRELSQDPRVKDLSTEQLHRLNFLLWIFIHGVASLRNWMQSQNYSEKQIIGLVQDGCTKILLGFIETPANLISE